ncbi:MAG: HK97 family phage prohead protease [Verrucomicrobiales bacterium]|nr:HK97 family phage prohead protease [Verrucomicrobiales bacterium]
MCRLNTGAPLLLNHNTDAQIGVVESAKSDGDRKGRATVGFSRSPLGDEIFQDVKDGIRRLVSVGYIIHETRMDGAKDGLVTVRATRWEPFELSIVPVPADASVGVGRALP